MRTIEEIKDKALSLLIRYNNYMDIKFEARKLMNEYNELCKDKSKDK